MSRFRTLTHAIWHCQYHIVWVPKCRYRILTGSLAYEVEQCVRSFSSQRSSEVLESSVQADHVHVVCMIPPKLSISDYVGIVKGRTAIRVVKKYPDLKKRLYWGNHFWAKGYCVDTVGLDAEKIRTYVKYQEAKERQLEQMKFDY
ncbi:MAG: IS200/IS605 family transposase [Planctomycetota bacterium]